MITKFTDKDLFRVISSIIKVSIHKGGCVAVELVGLLDHVDGRWIVSWQDNMIGFFTDQVLSIYDRDKWTEIEVWWGDK